MAPERINIRRIANPSRSFPVQKTESKLLQYQAITALEHQWQGPLCATFKWLARWVWRRRAAALAMGMPFSEETVTESVLLDLQLSQPHSVKIVPFTKAREAQNGADWEWCFFDLKRSLYMRTLVQAKVLDNLQNTYSHIDRYVGNSGELQIDRLLRAATARRIPALYVFYNFLSNPNRLPATCLAISPDYHAANSLWGCSVALADLVQLNLPDKSFDRISKFSKPWHCLICCNKTGPNSSIPEIVYGTLESLRLRLTTERIDFSESAGRPIPQPSSSPPEYLNMVLELNENNYDSVVRRLSNENPDIDGIVVVSENREVGQ